MGIKKFNSFSNIFNSAIPLSSITTYYECKKGHLYKEINTNNITCKFCGSPLSIITIDKYYDELRNRLEDDEYKEELEERGKEESFYINPMDITKIIKSN